MRVVVFCLCVLACFGSIRVRAQEETPGDVLEYDPANPCESLRVYYPMIRWHCDAEPAGSMLGNPCSTILSFWQTGCPQQQGREFTDEQLCEALEDYVCNGDTDEDKEMCDLIGKYQEAKCGGVPEVPEGMEICESMRDYWPIILWRCEADPEAVVFHNPCPILKNYYKNNCSELHGTEPTLWQVCADLRLNKVDEACEKQPEAEDCKTILAFMDAKCPAEATPIESDSETDEPDQPTEPAPETPAEPVSPPAEGDEEEEEDSTFSCETLTRYWDLIVFQCRDPNLAAECAKIFKHYADNCTPPSRENVRSSDANAMCRDLREQRVLQQCRQSGEEHADFCALVAEYTGSECYPGCTRTCAPFGNTIAPRNMRRRWY